MTTPFGERLDRLDDTERELLSTLDDNDGRASTTRITASMDADPGLIRTGCDRLVGFGFIEEELVSERPTGSMGASRIVSLTAAGERAAAVIGGDDATG